MEPTFSDALFGVNCAAVAFVLVLGLFLPFLSRASARVWMCVCVCVCVCVASPMTSTALLYSSSLPSFLPSFLPDFFFFFFFFFLNSLAFLSLSQLISLATHATRSLPFTCPP